MIWKNGVTTFLGSTQSFAEDVFVLGSDVYVVGEERFNITTTVATIWKNGVLTFLTNGANTSQAFSVYVK